MHYPAAAVWTFAICSVIFDPRIFAYRTSTPHDVRVTRGSERLVTVHPAGSAAQVLVPLAVQQTTLP